MWSVVHSFGVRHLTVTPFLIHTAGRHHRDHSATLLARHLYTAFGFSIRDGAALIWMSLRSCRRIHFWIATVAALPILLTAATGVAYRLARTSGASKDDVKWLIHLHTLSIIGFESVYPLFLSLLVLGLSMTGFFLSWLSNLLGTCLCCCCRRRNHRADSRNIHKGIARFEARIMNGGGVGNVQIDSDSNEPSEAEEEEEEDDDPTDYSFLDRRVPNPIAWTIKQRMQALLPRVFTWRWLHRACGVAIFVPFTITAITGGMYTIAKSWIFLEKEEYRTLMYLHEGRYIEVTGTIYVTFVGVGVLVLASTGVWMVTSRLACLRTITTGAGQYAAVSQPTGSAFAQPSANTMARIQKAFDINADETEDEGTPYAQ